MTQSHLEEIVELNKHPPKDIYVERQIVLICESNTPSITDNGPDDFSLQFGIKYRLSESYSLAMQFDDYTALDPIAGIITKSSRDAPKLWIQGPLSDITKETTIPENMMAELKDKEISLLNYHPTQRQSDIIRKQFFARVRALERLYQTIFETIAGSPRTTYERELKNAQQLKNFLLSYQSA